jgi:hypothetical protein
MASDFFGAVIMLGILYWIYIMIKNYLKDKENGEV